MGESSREQNKEPGMFPVTAAQWTVDNKRPALCWAPAKQAHHSAAHLPLLPQPQTVGQQTDRLSTIKTTHHLLCLRLFTATRFQNKGTGTRQSHNVPKIVSVISSSDVCSSVNLSDKFSFSLLLDDIKLGETSWLTWLAECAYWRGSWYHGSTQISLLCTFWLHVTLKDKSEIFWLHFCSVGRRWRHQPWLFTVYGAESWSVWLISGEKNEYLRLQRALKLRGCNLPLEIQVFF